MKRKAVPLVICLFTIVCFGADRQTSAERNTTPTAISVTPGVHYEIGKERYLGLGMPIGLTGAQVQFRVRSKRDLD